MKKILFVCYGLGIGGIEKCLVNLLNAMDKTEYQIDLLPLNPEYDMLPQLKDGINLLDTFDYAMNTTDTITALKNKKAGFGTYVKYALFRMENKFGKRPWMFFKSPPKHYDVAVAYSQNGFAPYYVADKVSADKKIMWHHEGQYIKSDKYNLDKKYFSQYDSLVAVSEDDKKILDDAFPNLKDKIKVIYNVMDNDNIIKNSNESIDAEFIEGRTKITTVGRLTEQKGPDIFLEVATMLKESKVDFIWYWVGDGNLYDFCSNEIKKNNLEGKVILLGNKNNPYPYIKYCDIYVQPSYFEAFCTTTREAQVLEKPIVVTDVCGMREQFVPEEDCIMTSTDANDVFNAIMRLIKNPDERIRLSSNLHKKMQAKDNFIIDHYNLFG